MLHPLLLRLVRETGARACSTPATFDAWAEQPGAAMVVFVEDPERIKESLDLAVIVPELVASRPGRFRSHCCRRCRHAPWRGAMASRTGPPS